MKFPSFQNLDPQNIQQQLQILLDDCRQKMLTGLEASQDASSLLTVLNEQGDRIERFWSPCGHLNAVLGSDAWRQCYGECLPLLTAYDTFIHQNEQLYQALDDADVTPLSVSQQKMREDFLLSCRLSGIGLPTEKRQSVEHIFERLEHLSQQFDNNVIDSQKSFKYFTKDLQELKGLPEYLIENAKNRAEVAGQPGYLFNLDQPSYLAIVTYAHEANLRKIFFKAYQTRGSDNAGYDQGRFDNTPLIQEILQLREELAHLVGLQHYADYSLSSKMAKSPARVHAFLDHMLEAVIPVAKKDYAVVKAYAKKLGHDADLQPWDIAYFMQLRQKELFSIDQEALRIYFPLKHVMYAINQLLAGLYQIHLAPLSDVDVWHPDAQCYLLKQGDKEIGALYCDWFSREGKRGGAWMDTLQTHTEKQLPIATLTCNFAVPAPGQDAGLTHDELTTLLHELGHCLHHLLSEVDEFAVSGVHGVEWDAVELPSQWMENWGWQADWVKIFSHHMKTGESLPDAQFTQLLAAKNDLVGLFLLRQLIFASYDFNIHSDKAPKDAQSVHYQYIALLKKYAVTPIDLDQRFPQAFSHIFSGGYAAGYYSYLWADVLSCDVFAWFEKNMQQLGDCGQAFRQKLLSKGGAVPALDAFVNLLGREPDQQALLRSYGLVE